MPGGVSINGMIKFKEYYDIELVLVALTITSIAVVPISVAVILHTPPDGSNTEQFSRSIEGFQPGTYFGPNTICS